MPVRSRGQPGRYLAGHPRGFLERRCRLRLNRGCGEGGQNACLLGDPRPHRNLFLIAHHVRLTCSSLNGCQQGGQRGRLNLACLTQVVLEFSQAPASHVELAGHTSIHGLREHQGRTFDCHPQRICDAPRFARHRGKRHCRDKHHSQERGQRHASAGLPAPWPGKDRPLRLSACHAPVALAHGRSQGHMRLLALSVTQALRTNALKPRSC